MAPIPSEDYYKLLFLCDDVGEGKPYAIEEGVLKIPVCGDAHAILKMDDLSKKKTILCLVEAGARKAALATSLCVDPIIDACREIERAGYANEWVWGEEASSEGNLIAQVRVVQDTVSTSVTLNVIANDGSLIAQREVYRGTAYAPDIWHRVLGDIEWISEEKAVFVFPDGRKSVLGC